MTTDAEQTATDELIERSRPCGTATSVALAAEHAPRRAVLSIETDRGEAFSFTLRVADVAKLAAGMPLLLQDVAD